MKTNKFIKYACLGIAGLFTTTSCVDIMDTEPSSSISEDMVWNSKATADAFVVGTYSNVLNMSEYKGSADFSPRTPYGVQDDFGSTDGFSRETYTVTDDYGIDKFASLRRCNLIIKKSAESTGMSDKEKTELIAEGHCLRAMVFFAQAQWFGRFIPATEVYSYPEDSEKFYQLDLTANPTESYKYVMDDFDTAIKGLPEKSSTGRLNLYAAHILRSRAALQAYAYTKDESYLDKALESCNAVINSGKYSLVSTQDAYKNMFLQSGAYNTPEIILGYYRLANNTQCDGINELIRTVPNNSNDDNAGTGVTDLFSNPGGIRVFEAWGNLFPTQDLVDMYLVNDATTGEALPWYETSQYKNNVEELDPNTCTKGSIDQYEGEQKRYMPTEAESATATVNWGNGNKSTGIIRYAQMKSNSPKNISELMYENRDARFYGTVVYDNSDWMGERVTTQFGGNLWCGARKYGPSSQFTTTSSYYWRKSVYEVSPRVYYNNKTDYHWVLCRLAEAYLNAAEVYLYKKDVTNAVAMLNVTRTTHGQLKPSTATTLEQAWSDYKRERVCEFVFEGSNLYFSMLRWGIANSASATFSDGYSDADVVTELDKPVTKIYISGDRKKMAVGYITYSAQYERKFTPEHRYMMPIPQGFIDKRAAFGIKTEQTPGW